jgi:hypothetical protein
MVRRMPTLKFANESKQYDDGHRRIQIVTHLAVLHCKDASRSRRTQVVQFLGNVKIQVSIHSLACIEVCTTTFQSSAK